MDYFTRLIEINSLGPNMATGSGSGEEPKKVYICSTCEDEHETFSGAEDCCPKEVYEEWACPACDITYSSLEGAEACCGCGGKQPMKCPVCLQSAESYEIAADCCLHTHPTMTLRGRQRIAEAVEKGTPWLEAVQSNINH